MFINACAEQTDLGSEHFRNVHHLKPVAYDDKGILKANVIEYQQKGTLALPMVLDRAPLIAQVGNTGNARFCPVRSDTAAYVEFGAPLAVGSILLDKVQSVKWSTVNYTMEWLHAGHYASWLMRPRKGWKLPSAIRFPVTVRGLEQKGDTFSLKGEPVCHMRAPVATDVNDPMNVVQLGYDWINGGVVIDTSKIPEGEWEIDPTLVLQPDAAAGEDTYINDAGNTNNYGIDTRLQHGRGSAGAKKRTLIRFGGLTAIPAGVTITRALLICYCTRGDTGAGVGNVHKALTQWYEGQQNGATPSGEDGSTWALRNHNGSVAWAGDAGGGSGSDYAAVATDTYNWAGGSPEAAVNTYITWDVTADVKDFYTTPANNLGWWIIGKEDTTSTLKDLAASDHATAAWRPQLTVDYTLPAAGGRVFQNVFANAFRGPFG